MMLSRDVLDFIEENDVKFIRLGFCDPMGIPKNISIMSNEFEHVFSNGRSIDSSAIQVYSDITSSDLLLFPDLGSLSLLPWRPQTNAVLRFYCDIKNRDKTSFLGDGRSILKKAISDLYGLGFSCKVGTKCEFYLFNTDEFDEPTTIPLDNGTYLDISPIDKGENIRREICLCLEDMGLMPENSHHEDGPGQNEIDFKFSDPLSAADNFLTFKSVVKSFASRNGLFASFMPKPLLDKSGSGLHLNISLHKDGENVFSNKESKDYKYAENFVAGILEKTPEITLFLNPLNNSYERLGEFRAPKYIAWSKQNRNAILRMPIASKERERIELRSPDSTLNPYVAFSLILYAGMYGIEHDLKLSNPIDEKSFSESHAVTNMLKSLPRNLDEAIELTKNSDFVKKYLTTEYVDSYIKIKEVEFYEFQNVGDKDNYYIENDFKIL